MSINKRNIYSLMFTGFLTSSLLTGCQSKDVKNENISWDDVKNSYVCLVNENGKNITELLKDNNNGIYEDIIDNKIFNKNDLVEYYSAIPYFVQTDNVKSEYTKEELKNIIKEFKIGSEEYNYTVDFVKVMK